MRSVRTQLLVGLIFVLGAMSILAGYGIFRSALEEANELFDYELRSVAISLPQSVADTALANKESGDFEGLQDDRVVIQVWDASGVLTYESVPGARLPRQRAGFQSVKVGERHYRVFGLQQASRFVQVGQPMSVLDTGVKDALAIIGDSATRNRPGLAGCEAGVAASHCYLQVFGRPFD